MNKTILQVPIETYLRDQAQTAASKAGFSSVQEVVRVFLYQFVSEHVTVSFVDRALSGAAEKRYETMIDDIKKGANIDHEGPIPQKI